MASQNSIDSINDTIVTQPKPSSSVSEKPINGTVTSGGSSVPSGTSVSSFERNPVSLPTSTVQSQIEPQYEPYRPPIISHERINPFDKNKTPSYESKPSGIYSSLSTNIVAAPPQAVKDDKKITEKYSAPIEIVTKPPPTAVSFTTTSGFDYSYKPPPLPVYSSRDSVEKQDSKPVEVKVEKSETSSRHKFERKLSDADIIFGSKPEPYTPTFNYGRNRSNSSFTSTSTDSGHIYGPRDSRKDNPFQKSLSVSSDTDGDFSHDPAVIASRNVTGINNDAFMDYDSPKTTVTSKKPWSNNDDDDDEDEYDLK